MKKRDSLLKARVTPVLTIEMAVMLARRVELGHATVFELSDPTKKIWDFSPMTGVRGDYRIERKLDRV